MKTYLAIATFFLLGNLPSELGATNVFFKQRALDRQMICRAFLNGIGRSRIAAIQELNQIDSSATSKVIDTLSGRANVSDYTYEQALAELKKWTDAYERYPLSKQQIALAKSQLKTRISEFSNLLSKSSTLRFPMAVSHLPTAPSIDFGVVNIQNVSRTPKIEFRNADELKYMLRKERFELEEVQAIDAHAVVFRVDDQTVRVALP